MRLDSRYPRFWLTIALLLLAQLAHPAICARRWESIDKRANSIAEGSRTVFPDELPRPDIPDEFDFPVGNFSESIAKSEDSGLLQGVCRLDSNECLPTTIHPYNIFVTIGKGLLQGLKIAGVVAAASCLSLSVASIVTCGGLTAEACQKYQDVKDSMDGLKDLASVAIDENGELRRWNASNLHLIYKLTSIKQEIETIVENNALLMDALGVLHYNSTATDMMPDETKDEYDEELQKKKLEIETDMEQYVRSLDDRMAQMQGTESIAFAVFAGISLMVQLMPSFLRGVRRLSLGSIKIKDLNVVVRSPASGVSMAVNMKTGKNYFVEVSKGTVTKVLGKVGKDGGMGGMFDIFASQSTKMKINEFMKDEKMINSQTRVGAKQIKCTKSNLDKLADWTKDMDDLQLDDFIHKIMKDKRGADNFLKNEANKPKVPKTLPNKGGIMSKLTSKFKPVGKFFTKIKNTIKSVSVSFTKTKLWQGMKKYGFDAIGAIMSAASIAMCVSQAVSTIQGAQEMNAKLAETATKIRETRRDLDSSRENIAAITKLQMELFKNLTSDSISMAKFFTNDTSTKEDNGSGLHKLKEGVSKETPKFRDLMLKLSNPNLTQKQLLYHLDYFKDLLAATRRSLIHIYRKVKISIQINNSVKTNMPVKIMLRNLNSAGYKVAGTYEIVHEIAWSRKNLDEYDNYPLNCVRKGTINDQLSLDLFMEASGTVVISERVKQAIKMAVDFYKSPVDRGSTSIVELLKVRNLQCDDRECNSNDILSVIAELFPDWMEYDGFDLEKYRQGQGVC